MRASVIIPCRNGARIVGEAVRSALAQTEPPLEVFVVDDASSDGTSEAARAAGARVLRTETRRNAGGARNIGIEASRGDVFAFLDADVVAPADWLERVRAAFEHNPDIVAVGGSVRNGRPGVWGDLDLYLNHSEWIGGRPSFKGLIPTLGVAYRRDAVGPVRFVETNLGEDASFGAAVLARGGKLWYDPEIVMTHRHERLDARGVSRAAGRLRADDLPDPRPPRPAGPHPGALPAAPLPLPPPLDRARADGAGGRGRQGLQALSLARRRRGRAHPGILRGAATVPGGRRFRAPRRRPGGATRERGPARPGPSRSRATGSRRERRWRSGRTS